MQLFISFYIFSQFYVLCMASAMVDVHQMWIRNMAFCTLHSGFLHLVGFSTRCIAPKQ